VNQLIENIDSHSVLFSADLSRQEKVAYLESNLDMIKDYRIQLEKKRQPRAAKMIYEIVDTGDDNVSKGVFFLRVSTFSIDASFPNFA